MDPLSVAASVAGLVSLAGQLVPTLYNLGSAVKEANIDAQAAATEVASMSVVLQGLQTYIIGRTRANPQRLRLITVEHITASLTACVFTYSELDAVLKALHVDSGLKAWDRAVWIMKRESVQNLVTRLQNHKMSFNCMLNILQCDSAGEAERSMDRLCDQVDLPLKENKELSGRLRNLEHLAGGASSQRSVAFVTRASLGQANSHTSAQSTTSQSSHVQSVQSNEQQTVSATKSGTPQGINHEPPRISAFEEQLHRSRVYRHAHANHSESSLVDDGRSTLALSICSSLTLGEVSNISVFALPVFAVELSNASAYTFARSPEAAKINAPVQRYVVSFQIDKPRTVITVTDSLSAQPTNDAAPKADDRQKSLGAYLRIKFRSGQIRSMNKKPQSTTEAQPGVFGVPLQTSIQYANAAVSLFDDEGQSYIYGYIPILVGKTGVYLKERATHVENIFATGSSLRRLREMQLIFDSVGHRYGRGWKLTGYTVHDAANLLLRYLLQLPEPVKHSGYYQRFRSTLSDAISTGTLDSEAMIQKFQKLVMQLPASNQDLLLYLLDLMAVFSKKPDDNKMTLPKLAALFQPCILSRPEHYLSPNEQRLSQDVPCFLVEKEEHFVVGMADTLGKAVGD